MNKKYVTFKHIASKPKTEVYRIITLKDGSSLGIIQWYAPWRQYCFFPGCNTVFSKGCLQEVINFMIKLMLERKK